MDVEEQQVRELYGLKSSEPNIIFALCCGIRSSPAVSTSRLIIVVAAARCTISISIYMRHAAPHLQSRSCLDGPGEGQAGVPAGIPGGTYYN